MIAACGRTFATATIGRRTNFEQQVLRIILIPLMDITQEET
jgi:hypothetical protein